MSKLPEACIAAAEELKYHDGPEARARRVILALAENLPDSAVKAALDDFAKSTGDPEEDMRAAIVAALKEIGVKG